MLCINEEVSYRRIGKKIYIISQVEDEEFLYEFEGHAFNILNCIIYNSCNNVEKIKMYLSREYEFEESADSIINQFINELKSEKIILEK